MDLYFFDLDNTLYAYDFRYRLPELARLSGVSQYRIAKNWWAAGHEERAELGQHPMAADYLAAFAEATGGRVLALEEWAQARALAMTRIEGSVAALAHAATLGTVCLLSNNPSATAAALPILAPDVVEILGPNILVSYQLEAKKPSAQLYERALAHFGAAPEQAFLADDRLDNVRGARAVGMTAHHFREVDGAFDTASLRSAIDAFAGRHS